MKETKAMRIARYFDNMLRAGFNYEEADKLRKCERTLQRWGELECGDGNEYGSWSIERDESTGKPFMVHHHYLHGRGKDYTTRTAIADREAGALKRANAIVAAHPGFVLYHQGDPRGCSLYVVRASDIPSGESVDLYYYRGLACCID